MTYEVPEEILPLIGPWYYEETRDGESLTFHEDSSCVFHYYQDYGGYLTGWVSRTGSWRYDSEDNIISITMPGEITYPYILEIRTIDTLFLEPPENGPGGTSMIYSGTCLYK